MPESFDFTPANLAWAEDPAWTFGGGMFHVKCDYRLMIDNLMDLTHEKYVHATSIGQQELDEVPAHTSNDGEGVVTRREMNGVKAPPFWQAAMRDTTTTVLSIDLLLGMQRAIRQNGADKEEIWTGFKQRQNLYSLLQNQVRFSSDGNLTAGADQTVSWNDARLEAYADILDTDLFMLSPKDLIRVTSSIDKPTWASDLQGTETGMNWNLGTTKFTDALVWPVNFGAHRRNTHAAATALQ